MVATSCGFESHHRHQKIRNPENLCISRLSGFSFDFPMFFAAYAVRNFNIVLSKAAKRYNLKDVSDRAAQEIERITGINVKGNKTAIEKRMIEHIFIRHGKKGKADQSLSDNNDITRMQYVLDNFDSVEDGGATTGYVTNGKDGKHHLARSVVFSKKINGTYFVVEAVSDTSKKTVYVVSARMQKEAPSPMSVNAKALRPTSDNAATGEDASIEYIPSSTSAVNPEVSQTSTQNTGAMQDSVQPFEMFGGMSNESILNDESVTVTRPFGNDSSTFATVLIDAVGAVIITYEKNKADAERLARNYQAMLGHGMEAVDTSQEGSIQQAKLAVNPNADVAKWELAAVNGSNPVGAIMQHAAQTKS